MKVKMKEIVSGKIRMKPQDRVDVLLENGWEILEDQPKKQTKTVVLDEPVTLTMTDVKSEDEE